MQDLYLDFIRLLLLFASYSGRVAPPSFCGVSVTGIWFAKLLCQRAAAAVPVVVASWGGVAGIHLQQLPPHGEDLPRCGILTCSKNLAAFGLKSGVLPMRGGLSHKSVVASSSVSIPPVEKRLARLTRRRIVSSAAGQEGTSHFRFWWEGEKCQLHNRKDYRNEAFIAWAKKGIW